MIEKIFRLQANQTTVRTEVLAGTTTFVTMSYIIFVQPVILSNAGMDFGAVMTATCLASAIGTILMAFLANYPIAMAPAMGHNLFFAFVVCGVMGFTWQQALGANFISGVLFIVLAAFRFREKLLQAVPEGLKNAIAAGIGLLIALVGLGYGGLVVKDPGFLLKMGNLHSAPVLLTLFGTAVISILLVLKIRGAILWGILATALVGIPFGLVQYQGQFVASPPSMTPTLLKLDIFGVLNTNLLVVIFVFFFLDLFDTVGTLIGVSERAGFVKNGKLPRAGRALMADAIATVSGTCLGTSTVTSYVESATGVSEGGRTGFANLVTALLFLLSLFFYPLVKMVGGGYMPEGASSPLYPAIAPALIIVGCFMIGCVKRVDWEDYSEAIPAFLTVVIMSVTMNITEGIAFGFISYSGLKSVRGEGKKVHPLIHVFALLFVLRYIFL